MKQIFKLRQLRFPSGERLPIVIDTRSGRPVVEILAYILSEMRASCSPNTIKQFCGVMHLFFLWLESKEINITQRIRTTGVVMLDHEIHGLISLYTLYSDDFVAQLSNTKTKSNTTPKVVSLEKARQKLKSPAKAKSVEHHTLAIRVNYTRLFLANLANSISQNLSLSEELRNSITSSREIMEMRFNSLLPPPDAKPDAPWGLTEAEWEYLHSISSATHPRNPWLNSFVRRRNELIIRTLHGLGVRGGELLSLKVSDIKRDTSSLAVEKRPDDPADPRISQPLAKTLARELPLTHNLAHDLLAFIKEDRAGIPAHKRKHGYIFTTKDGAPLSLQSLGDIFRDLRVAFPELPVNLTAHKLRYTHTDGLWKGINESSGEDNAKLDQLRRFMGWSMKSTMPFKYGARYLSDTARAAYIAHQKKVYKRIESNDVDEI